MTAIERAPLLGRVVVHVRWTRIDRPVPGWAVAAASALPVLLVPSWAVADTLQPATYDPVRQSISVLAGHAGTDRWIVTGALLLMGLCYLLAAAGLRLLGPAARVGLVVAGLAGLGVALCPEPVRGSTVPHMAFTTIGAIALTVWPALVPYASPPRPVPLLGRQVANLVTAVFAALLLWTFVEAQTGPSLGLAERVTTSAEVCWPVVVAVALWRAAIRPGTMRAWFAVRDSNPEPAG